jgi:hypothetical protein
MTATNKVTVTETLNDLARYDSIGLYLWATPGATRPYWASNASFKYDTIVATVNDFAGAAGYDDGFGFEDEGSQEYLEAEGETEYSLEVEMPEYIEHLG